MIEIRYAKNSDLPALNEIFNYYVFHSNGVFDTEPQTLEQREIWFKKYKNSGPHRLLVAVENSEVIGCAYSSRYRDHKAFDKTVVMSIYLHEKSRGKGIGTTLYNKLFQEIASDVHLAVAGIALPNDASIALHKRLGFVEVGVFREYAEKNGKFISSIWLQKPLNGWEL